MNATKRKTSYLKVGLVFSVIALICIITFIGINRVSLDKLPDYISSDEYDKVVKAYNKYAVGDVVKEEECSEIINDAITNIVLSWSAGETSVEDATNRLDILCGLNNKELSDTALTNKYFIIFENESNERYEQAESLFKSGQYFEALQTLIEIDPSYSQYDFVKEFIGECEEVLVAQVSYPTTVEEYKECQSKVDEYLEVHSCKAFIQQKKKLNEEYDTFVSAAPFLTKARAQFKTENYKAAFDILEKAKEDNPNNRFIKETLDEFHNVFLVGKAQEIIEEVKNENYDKASDLVEAAIEVYDCEDLQSIKKYVLEQKYPPYGYLNNVVDKITSTFRNWTAEDFDVKQARSDAGAYVVRSGKKMALGDYDEGNVTLLSVSGEVATSLIGVDMALDARDLYYDITHWGSDEYFALRIATDAVALVPVVGAVKYLKYSKEAGKGIKKGAKTAKDVIGGTTGAAKATNKILDSSTELAKNADESATIAKVCYQRYVKINTKCENYLGKQYPGTKVYYIEKKVTYKDGRKIKGVFPKFKSKKDLQLPESKYKSTEKTQIRWLNNQLLKQAEKGELNGLLSTKELNYIKYHRDKAPVGYVWHHSEEEGLMQLVDLKEHEMVRHTGGMSIWGRGYKQ